MVHLASYGVAFGYRQIRVYSDVHFGVQPVSQPSCPDLRDVLHTGNAACGVPYLLYRLRLHPVQQAGEDGLARLPDDHQDRPRYEQPHDGIGKRVAQPNSYCPGQDGEARPTVRPRMVSVGHERRAPYLPTHPDAKHSDCLVAYEADQRSRRYHPQESHGLGLMSRSRAWYPATTALKRMMRTMTTPAKSSTLPYPNVKRLLTPRRVSAKAIPSGMAVAAPPKLWMVSESRATLPESSTTTSCKRAVAISPHERPLDGPYTTLGG